MLHITDTGAEMPQGSFCAIIVTSTSALMVLQQRGIPTQLKQLPVFCVGDKTAAKAEKVGFSKVRSAGGTAMDLGALVVNSLPDKIGGGRNVLYLCGVDTTPGLAGILKGDRVNLCRWVLYKANLVNQLTKFSVDWLRNSDAVGVLLFSARTADQFVKTANAYNLLHDVDNIKFFAISEKVKAALPDRLQLKCKVASLPTERGLFDLIQP
jgi:uroporphyrinogen-III synthase